MSPSRRLSDYFRLLRPEQWVKNLFVFLPAFFAGRIADLGLLSITFVAFVSLGYVIPIFMGGTADNVKVSMWIASLSPRL